MLSANTNNPKSTIIHHASGYPKKRDSANNSKSKWLLVQPKSSTSMMVDSGSVSMPLNLIMVATLAGRLFDVTLIDERIGDRVPEDFSDFDVVAITSRTLNARNAYNIGDRALAQKKIVLLGGVHPTMMHDEAIHHCTSVVYGEVESIWDELETDIINKACLQGKRTPIHDRYELTGFRVCPSIEKCQKVQFQNSDPCNERMSRRVQFLHNSYSLRKKLPLSRDRSGAR
jgi:hypothetical protein